MMDLISVIIPIFNTGDLLYNCVTSIVNQDYPNLEIILVDDGSTDSHTINLCDILAQEHNNVSSYHKPNGGSASARNYGIGRAKGKYIGFVDSDDAIDKEMYSKLHSCIVKAGAKVSICALSTETNGHIELNDKDIVSGCYNNHELLHHYFLGHWHSACTCLYEKSIIENIKFPEGEVNEDYMFNYLVFRALDKLYFINKPYYHYLRREDSNTSSPKTLKFLDWIKHTEYVLNDISHDKSLILEAEYQYLYSNIILGNSSILTMNRVKSREANELYKIVVSNLQSSKRMLKRSIHFSKRNKLMGYAMAYTPRLYKNIILSALRIKSLL